MWTFNYSFFLIVKFRDLIPVLWQHQAFLIAPLTDIMVRLSAQVSGVPRAKSNGQAAIYFYSFLRRCFYYLPIYFCKLEHLCANDWRYRKLYSRVLDTFSKGLF